MKRPLPKKPNILFVHTVCPSQFSDLCEHLNVTGAANAFYMTTPGNLEKNKARYQNLIPLTPDGNMMAANSYYYSGKVERAGRVSLGLHRKLKELLQKRKLDLIVAHGSLGSPHLIFGEFDIPIITYIEFPSYADHGWDPKYPPTEPQRLSDKNMQMLSFYEVIKSQKILVPSDYARSMYPDYLQSKIVAHFEGLDPEKVKEREPAGIALPRGKKTLGFAARDLSSAKGLESFIATAAHLINSGEDIHFVVIGDPAATTYGYERVFLDRKYGKDSAVSFIDHLMRKHKIDGKHFTRTGKLPYAQFSDLIHNIDLFLYPVKYGSGNWGLLELLIRGRPVVAAARCYVPEIIEDGVNGILIGEDKPEVWARVIRDLMSDESKRTALGERALSTASSYHLPVAAQRYMALFEEVIRSYRER
jgi:glycosyltransferase involved in cell wall biosynthesis